LTPNVLDKEPHS